MVIRKPQDYLSEGFVANPTNLMVEDGHERDSRLSIGAAPWREGIRIEENDGTVEKMRSEQIMDMRR